MIFLFCFRRALRRGESVKYLLQDVVIDYIRTNHLYGAEDKWVRAAWIHSRCLCTITISVHQAVYVSNCFPLSLFISYKFVQDCHQLIEFQFFFSFFWKNPSWYVTGIFIYCMVFTSVAVHEFYLWWLDPAFIFIIRIYILIIHVVYTKLSLICL